MVKLVVSIAIFTLTVSALADTPAKTVKQRPVLAEMQNLFSLIQSLRHENKQLKDELLVQEANAARIPATVKSAKDPNLVLINKMDYDLMVKEIQSLKEQNVVKEKLIQEMEKGF